MTRRVHRTRSVKTTRRRVARSRGARRMGAKDAQAEALGATVQPTAVAVEALRTGVVPYEAPHRTDHATIAGREGEAMRAGDPDVSSLDNEYSGEELPGASAPAPDQNDVDAIGHAYGIEEADTGALRTSHELLEQRDRRRR